MGITNPTAHAWVIRMNVRLAAEILRHVGLVRVQSSGRKRVEDTHCGTIEFRVPLSWNGASTEAEFGAIREEDFLRGR